MNFELDFFFVFPMTFSGHHCVSGLAEVKMTQLRQVSRTFFSAPLLGPLGRHWHRSRFVDRYLYIWYIWYIIMYIHICDLCDHRLSHLYLIICIYIYIFIYCVCNYIYIYISNLEMHIYIYINNLEMHIYIHNDNYIKPIKKQIPKLLSPKASPRPNRIPWVKPWSEVRAPVPPTKLKAGDSMDVTTGKHTKAIEHGHL